MAGLQEPVIEVVLSLLVKRVLQYGPDAAKGVWHRFTSLYCRHSFVRRAKFVDRQPELDAIEAVLKEEHDLRVLYFSGSGGVGKTRLLQEVENLVREIRTTPPLRWTSIIDLYHSDFHSVSGLRTALLQRLDPNEEHFSQYRDARKQYERRRHAGVSRRALQVERDRLEELFLTEYNTFARSYRPVIAFDTLESLSYESDLIQELCQLEDTLVAAGEWILQQAKALENTVLLLAGRPQPAFEEQLKQSYDSEPGRYESFPLTGLSREDSRRLLAALLNDAPAAVHSLYEYRDEIWYVTQGRPVQIALTIELAIQMGSLDVSELDTVLNNPALFGRRLVEMLFNVDDPENRIFFFLALARRGLTVELLHYLEPAWSEEECRRRLAAIGDLSVVKVRSGSQKEYFLHDAAYELFDEFSPPTEKLNIWHERFADYYQKELAVTRGNNARLDGAIVIRLLYYEFQYAPRRAFQHTYVRHSERAIKGYELGLDMQLRDELLRCFRELTGRRHVSGLSRERIDLDSAVRWIKRYVAQQRYHRAIRVVELFLTFIPESDAQEFDSSDIDVRPIHLSSDKREQARALFEHATDLFWGEVLTYYGETLAYIGASEVSNKAILEAAIQRLTAFSCDLSSPLLWSKERTLGRAHNSMGYLLRSYGHYGQALDSYRRALEHFAATRIADEQANTLNNQAFVLALLGEGERAKIAVNRALNIRRELQYEYPRALSLNTRGIIYGLFGQTTFAKDDVTRALNIFEDLEEPRGIGLACNAFGFVLRREASEQQNGTLNRDRAYQLYEQATEYFQRAIDVFSPDTVDEPLRLWEAHNELGSIFRDWGFLQNTRESASASDLYKRAIDHYESALAIAEEHGLRFQATDTYDDIAQVHAYRGDMDSATYWLERVFSAVPEEYTVEEGRGFQDTPEPGEAYWLILAKAYWQQTMWTVSASSLQIQATSDRQDMARHAALSIAYFRRFWPTSDIAYTRANTLVRRLRESHVPLTDVRTQTHEIASQYNVDLSVLMNAIDNT